MNRADTNLIPRHILTPREVSGQGIKSIPFAYYQSRHQAFDWHRHNFYELMVVETGSGTHEIDFIDYPVESAQFFVLHPNQVHRLQRANLLAGRVLIFEDTLLTPVLRQSIFEHFYTLPGLTPGSADYQAMVATFTAIQHELVRPHPSAPVLTSMLQTLFLQLLRGRQANSVHATSPSDYDYSLFVRFRSQLDQARLLTQDVATYAEDLAITKRKLNEVSRRFMGKTARQLLTERMVLEAKRLLVFSSDEVKTIAFTLNFADPFYFSRFFKQKTGMSPEQFRAGSRHNTPVETRAG